MSTDLFDGRRVRCVVLDDYQGVSMDYADWDTIPKLRVDVVRDHLSGDALLAAIENADIIVAMRERTPFPGRLLRRLPHLRLLVTTAMVNASIDLGAARERGITVCGTPSLPTPHVEHTWALIHALTRNVVGEVDNLRRGGPWQRFVGFDLHGRTIGIVGLGRSGQRVAAVAKAFGMHVLAWSPHLTPEAAADRGAGYAPLTELMSRSDVVSLHLILAASTRGLIGAGELRLMKPTAFLVNTSRAGLVDTPALVAALKQDRIAGAGLDVFDVEPLPVDDELRSLATVVATPHIGYVTDANYREFYRGALADIAAWLDGSPVRVLT